jgi:hypothetical protein
MLSVQHKNIPYTYFILPWLIFFKLYKIIGNGGLKVCFLFKDFHLCRSTLMKLYCMINSLLYTCHMFTLLYMFSLNFTRLLSSQEKGYLCKSWLCCHCTIRHCGFASEDNEFLRVIICSPTLSATCTCMCYLFNFL